MTTICVLGAGEIAGAAAHALARGERVSRVLLIDADGKVAAGKALDIQQSGAVDRFHVRLDGTDDVSRVAGCAAVIVADRVGRPSAEWQGDDGLAMMTRVASYVLPTPPPAKIPCSALPKRSREKSVPSASSSREAAVA